MDHAEYQIGNQHHPYLGFDPLPAVREKITQLEVLLDFFKERLDLPAVFVQKHYGMGPEVKQVAQKAEYFACQWVFVSDQSGLQRPFFCL